MSVSKSERGKSEQGKPGRNKSDLQIDISDLQPNQRKEKVISALLPEVKTSVAELADDELHADLCLEIAGEDLMVRGKLSGSWRGECRRCLDEVQKKFETPIEEVFSKTPVEGETYPLFENTADLTEMAREAVLLALPIAPLCKEDCEGPMPGAYFKPDFKTGSKSGSISGAEAFDAQKGHSQKGHAQKGDDQKGDDQKEDDQKGDDQKEDDQKDAKDAKDPRWAALDSLDL